MLSGLSGHTVCQELLQTHDLVQAGKVPEGILECDSKNRKLGKVCVCLIDPLSMPAESEGL